MDDKLKVGIGNKEQKKLQPKNVKIVDISIEMQRDKEKNKDVGEKIILLCAHPDKSENIKLSAVLYVKNKEIKNSGLWYQLDEDGKLGKESATSNFLRFYKASSLAEMIGKEIATDLDDKGYLCAKAY